MEKMTVQKAALEMGKAEQFIRLGLQRQILHFGSGGSNMTTVNQTPQTSDLSIMGLEQYDNACIIGKYLEGSLKPSDELIIRRLKNGNH